jgi:peptidoglycan/LPS O-acetylase OafA/YrhL
LTKLESNSQGAGDRRTDIDYLRVAALLLLIVYHVLLVFSQDWWRVESSHQGPWADYLINVLTPWRMALVFMIGGMAARFMIEKMSASAFVAERAGKLLTAFVFAVVVLIPLQRYVRMDDEHAGPLSYVDFLLLRARYAVEDFGIWLPDFANAWFLPYLFAYSAIAALLWRFAPRVFGALQRLVDAAPIWVLAGVGMLWYAFVEAAIIPAHPVSGLFIPDLGGHLRFAPVFLFGMLVGKSEIFTAKLLDAKIVFWIMAAALLIVTLSMQWRMIEGGPFEPLFRDVWRVLRGFYGICMLFSALGLAMWVFTKPSNLLTWASDAILPVYLIHQTVLVVAADALVPHRLPLAVEVATLFGVTLLIPIAIYCVLVRRTPWLRVLFGLRPNARPWRENIGPAPEAAAEPAHRL